MNTFLKLLGALSSFFVIIMTLIAALSLRKPRKISSLSTFISGIVALIAMLVMVLLGGLRIRLIFVVPTLLLGVLFGFVRGQLVKFNLVGKQVVGRNSILFIILWGLSLGVSLLLSLFNFPWLASLGLLPVIFSTGLQIGYNLNLFLRRVVIHLKNPGKHPFRQGGLATALNLKTYPQPAVKPIHPKTHTANQ